PRSNTSTENVGRALPFTHIQQRLGRKSPSAELIRQYPVAYLAFDVLYANSDLTIDRPLHERRAILTDLFRNLAKPAPDAAFTVTAQSTKSRTKKPSSQQDLFANP